MNLVPIIEWITHSALLVLDMIHLSDRSCGSTPWLLLIDSCLTAFAPEVCCFSQDDQQQMDHLVKVHDTIILFG